MGPSLVPALRRHEGGTDHGVRRKTCIVAGAGITGATAAWYLHGRGWDVTVYEAQPWVGGQLRGAFHGDIPYEPLGPHNFHTSTEEAYQVVRQNCELNSYRHRAETVIGPRRHVVTWPLQVSELERLPEWPQIKDELNELPKQPDKANFETYAVSIMGKTLYEWCVYGYTVKQWGTDPRLLSSSFAPKRLDLRTDGIRDFFRDPYQGWCEGGWHTLVENLLEGIYVELGRTIRLATLPAADAYVITAPLDEFMEADPLPWRGVSTRFECRDSDGPVLSAAVINQPSIDVPYTRMVETRQMTEAAPSRGTVIGYEYPGAPVRHYPVADAAGENRARHKILAEQLLREVETAVIAGRLASYVYCDVDQAIVMGLNAARKILGRWEDP